MPKQKEVARAMRAAGIDRDEAEVIPGNQVVHVYQPVAAS